MRKEERRWGRWFQSITRIEYTRNFDGRTEIGYEQLRQREAQGKRSTRRLGVTRSTIVSIKDRENTLGCIQNLKFKQSKRRRGVEKC